MASLTVRPTRASCGPGSVGAAAPLAAADGRGASGIEPSAGFCALAAGDYVVVAKPAAAQADNPALAAALIEVLKRAGALPATHVAVTMRVDPHTTDPGRPRGRPDPSLPA